MDITQATYAELKSYRDQIETRLRELEQQTLADIEQKLRDFGITTTTAEPKQKRHRRTKEQIAAANAAANGGAVVE